MAGDPTSVRAPDRDVEGSPATQISPRVGAARPERRPGGVPQPRQGHRAHRAQLHSLDACRPVRLRAGNLSGRSLCTLSCRGTRRIDLPGPVSDLLLRACAHLNQPHGFTESMRPGYYPLHTPQTPASREPGDSRRAPAVRGWSCRIPGPSRRLRSRVARVSPRCHQAGPERSAQRGGHSWVGLHELRWATARPDPAAGSQNPERGFGG